MPKPAFVHWIQVAWSWRDYHPTTSCMVTGLWVMCGLIAGIVNTVDNAGGSGVLLSLIGIVLLGLVLYAAYDTNWFQDWKANDAGTAIEGHSVARAIGPLSLSAAVLLSMVALTVWWLMFIIIGAVARDT